MEAGARPDGRLNKTFTGGTALRVAEAAGHTTIVSFLRGHRRAPAPAAAASVSVEERAAAERNAELAATALLAEEAAEGTRKQHAQQKKASKKSKAKMGANADSGGAADRAKAVAVTEAAVAAEPAAVAAADEALRKAMALAQYEALARALEQHCAQASEGVLAEARALRERLHKKQKKESQKLRRAHAVEMEELAGMPGLSLADASPQLPHAVAAATPAAAAPPPAAAQPLIVTSLADAQLDTGRPEAPESTIGGQTTCIVCFTNPKSHAAVPCGHQCACGACSAQMKECPVCRSPALMWMHVRVA